MKVIRNFDWHVQQILLAVGCYWNSWCIVKIPPCRGHHLSNFSNLFGLHASTTVLSLLSRLNHVVTPLWDQPYSKQMEVSTTYNCSRWIYLSTLTRPRLSWHWQVFPKLFIMVLYHSWSIFPQSFDNFYFLNCN